LLVVQKSTTQIGQKLSRELVARELVVAIAVVTQAFAGLFFFSNAQCTPVVEHISGGTVTICQGYFDAGYVVR
jgi:hypothetical protein